MRGRRLERWIRGRVDKWIPQARAPINPTIHLSKYPFILLLTSVLALTLLAGCGGYSLGPTNGLVAGEKKIQITPFLNHTLEPRLGDAVTTALRRKIQVDGTYRLATQGNADVVVTGVLTKYTRHELNFEPHDVLTVQDYRVSVIAQVTAQNLATGSTVIFTNTAYTLVRVGSDLTSSERQAMPVLADQLAKTVTDELVDGGW